MANSYLTIGLITFEMLMILHNNTVAASKVTRKYEKQFAQTGAKVGASIQVRKPPRYTVTKGATFVGQDYADEMVPLVVDQHDQVGCEFQNDDLTLSMDDFSGRFLKPALVPLANSVDMFIMSSYADVWNATGTPGSLTVAATDTPWLDAKNLVFINAGYITPDMPMIVTGKTSARLSSGLAQRFNPAQEISELYRKGAMAGMMKQSMGHALGWNFYEDQNMPVHTTGAWAGATPTVDVAGQTGASITTTGWTANITGLGKKGDVVQFARVYTVNPVTYQSTGELQNFTLTADVDSDNSTNATLPISPSIIIAGKTQTVSASPAATAAVTVWGTGTIANVASVASPQNMGWQNEAITLACVDLMLPGKNEGVDAVRVSDDDLGLSFTFMRSFDVRAFSRVSRVDILYGKGYMRPEHIVRVAS